MPLILKRVPEKFDEVALTRMVRIAYALDPEDHFASVLLQLVGQFAEAAQGESNDEIRIDQEVQDLNFFLELVGDDLRRLLRNSAEFAERVQQFLGQHNIEIVYTKADS